MVSDEQLKKYGFVKADGSPDREKVEVELHVEDFTDYPVPWLRYRLLFESTQQYIEEHYYWIMHNARFDFGFNHIDKITDLFAAAEQSAFFGVSEQRLAFQQDRVSQYLKGISEMLKALFQIVREIRIIDERVAFYDDTYARGMEAEGSEITLKGIWIDQVEGGVKNAGSVYGLAQTVGFTILPDLFFRIKINDSGMDKLAGDWEQFEQTARNIPEQIDKEVRRLEFNEKVKEVLKRKLTQYYIWKNRTYKELVIRKRFTIKYLRQHYDTIKLYMGWIKPYLRNIRKLTMDQRKMDSWELLSAFEGSMLEVEILCSKQEPDYTFFPCILLSFMYRTRPMLSYVAEGYQRGPIHLGKMELTFRAYVWNKAQVENFKNMKMEEDFELLSTINESIKESMDALGDELKRYLMGEGEKFPERPKMEGKKAPYAGASEPFSALFEGVKEMVGGLGNVKAILPAMGGGQDVEELANEIIEGRKFLRGSMWILYKNYKKFHNMMQW